MNKKLRAIFVSNGIFVFANSLLVPVYALFINKIGGGIELAGILFGLKFGANSLADLVMTRVTDKAKLNENLLIISVFLRSAVYLWLGLAPSIAVFVIAQIILGVAESLGNPTFAAIVAERLDAKKHIREYAIWELLKNPAIAVASIASGFVVVKFGFSSLFFIMSGLSFVSMIAFVQAKTKYPNRQNG